MSYKHKGFDNNAFELDVVDSPYGAKGMCNELSRFLFWETKMKPFIRLENNIFFIAIFYYTHRKWWRW